jgi:hypothetical protein
MKIFRRIWSKFYPYLRDHQQVSRFVAEISAHIPDVSIKQKICSNSCTPSVFSF